MVTARKSIQPAASATLEDARGCCCALSVPAVCTNAPALRKNTSQEVTFVHVDASLVLNRLCARAMLSMSMQCCHDHRESPSTPLSVLYAISSVMPARTPAPTMPPSSASRSITRFDAFAADPFVTRMSIQR